MLRRILLCLYWSNEGLQIHVLVDSTFMGKFNFLYIFPCPYFIGFFFNHVGSAMGKQIWFVYNSTTVFEYEASYSWLGSILHIDSIMSTRLAIENDSIEIRLYFQFDGVSSNPDNLVVVIGK